MLPLVGFLPDPKAPCIPFIEDTHRRNPSPRLVATRPLAQAQLPSAHAVPHDVPALAALSARDDCSFCLYAHRKVEKGALCERATLVPMWPSGIRALPFSTQTSLFPLVDSACSKDFW